MKKNEKLRQSTKETAISERQILVTRCVAEAWERFCEAKNLVVKTFRKVRLSLPIDGSRDKELSIKDIP